MKKTTWVIIGLSVCVVALAAALVVVLTQPQPDPVKPTETLLKSRSFSLSGPIYTKSAYFTSYAASFKYPAGFEKTGEKVDFLGEKISGYPGKVIFLKRPVKK
jgi:hypothetical protein